jgi:hypothetical protein
MPRTQTRGIQGETTKQGRLVQLTDKVFTAVVNRGTPEDLPEFLGL